MFEEITNQMTTILTLSIGGISLGSIIALAIALIKMAIKNKKTSATTTQQIEAAFRNVVLPKNIKLDISNKIEVPIKNGFNQIAAVVDERFNKLEEGQRLTMAILSQFTHVQKLPPETQAEIMEYTNKDITETIDL